MKSLKSNLNKEILNEATLCITELFDACGHQSLKNIRHELLDQSTGIDENNIDLYLLPALNAVENLDRDEDDYYGNCV